MANTQLQIQVFNDGVYHLNLQLATGNWLLYIFAATTNAARAAVSARS